MDDKIIDLLKSANNDTPYEFKKEFAEILKVKIRDKYNNELIGKKQKEE